MKRRLLLLLFWAMSWTIGNAQLAPGTIAPNFTVTDIDGTQHNLYGLLDQGYTVYLDFFATWCGPCWNYHNGHALKNIWDTYGPSGTNQAYVIAIEGDPATNVSCIYGPSGCNNTTQGDWTANTPYPIADDTGVRQSYAVAYYPTIYMVCPGTKKVYETGQLSMTGLWNRRTQYCALAAIVEVTAVTNVRCFGGNNGKITLASSGALGPYSYQWSNGTTNTTGILNNIPAGTYACTVTPTQGASATVSDIIVAGPPSAISVSLVEMINSGCNGVPGSMTIEAAGGWPGSYNYQWSNGQQNPEITSIPAGNYTVSVTDVEGCTKTQTFTLSPAPPLAVSIAAPGQITCANNTIQLNANASSQGFSLSYNWFASNGGNIVSGGNTLTPVVGAAGSYSMQIVNSQTTCTAFGVTSVAANIVTPTAVAGPAAAINCNQITATLQGSGSTGANFTYLWTATGGGNIASGSTTLTPIVNAAGNYTLKVTNTINGCTSTSTTAVTGSNSTLAAVATGGAVTCANTSVALNATSTSSNATYAWTGPNGFISNLQSPVVTNVGSYNVLVTDASGCSGTASAAVSANNALPGAMATGGAITCATTSVTLNGSSAANAVGFSWTGPNGFTATIANPSVSLAGDYQLVVTDPANGCSSSVTTNVAANNALPTAVVAAANNLNCNNAQVQLNATASSQGNQFEYSWTTTNGTIASGANSLTPLVSAAGLYNLLITNTQTGCNNISSVNVLQSAPINSQATATAASCNGASNGSATSTASGGNGIYTYLWSNGASTASVSSLSAGQYIVVTTDGEGCTTAAMIQVSEPAILNANVATTSQSANGVNNGAATANPSGGSGGYNYLWSTNATTSSIENLAPGTYTVTVGDANACTAVQIVTVNAFNCALSATITANNINCFGSNNGSAAVNLTGANGVVSYNWSNGGTGSTVENLGAGSYTVSVLDGNNCPAQLNVEIVQPASLQANTTSTNETASGANDGTATAAPVGGTGTYSYLWSNGATASTIIGLTPGIYTATVTDQNNCTSVRSVTVNSFDCILSTNISVLNVACNGTATGSVTVGITGGTAPFTYNWNNGAQTAAIQGLNAGSYTVNILDNNGCATQSTATVTEPSALQSGITSVVNTLCPNEAAGVITLSVSGGVVPYAYNWSNGASTQNLIGVTAGTYQVVITDAAGCTRNQSATVTSNDTQPPSITTSNSTIALNAQGGVTVTAAMLSVVASDNCGAATWTTQPVTYSCADLGQHQIVVTATDATGNTATSLATITIIDNIVPQVTCPASIYRCFNENTVEYPAPFAVDNCLTGGTWSLVAGLPSNSVFPTGTTTTQTYNFTDIGSNTGSCSFNVTVGAPIIVAAAVNNSSNNLSNGGINLSVSGGLSPYMYQWTRDGVPLSTNEDLSDLPAGTYGVVVSDAAGCKSGINYFTVTTVVSAYEPTWLSGVSVRPNPTSGETQIVFTEIPDETVYVSVSDAAGRQLVTRVSEGNMAISLDCSQLPEGMYLIQMRTSRVSSVRKLMVQR